MVPRAHKKLLIILRGLSIDLFLVLVAYFLALNFRFWGTVAGWTPWTLHFLVFAAFAVIAHMACNLLFNVHRMIPQSISLVEVLRLAGASFTAVLILAVVVLASPAFTSSHEYLVPRSVVAGGGVAATAAMAAWRFLPRAVKEVRGRLRKGATRVLVVGAGQAADALIRDIARTPQSPVRIVGLVDDDPALRGMHLHGHPVLGPVEEAPQIVNRKGVDEIIVAIPSATADQVSRIYRLCHPAGVPIKILPGVRDFLSGRVTIGQARDLDLKDLLSRPVVVTDLQATAHRFQGTAVLVTGAAGSIGSELCRQIARHGPARLLMVDYNESGLYELSDELARTGFWEAHPCLLNILDEEKLDKLLAEHRPAYVFHAAAYKHVPLMELAPDKAVINNILGTMLVAQTSGRHGVGCFINISTDKAVEPVSVMGATKWAGELLVASLCRTFPDTHFASVRFGNVLGSRGSVVPLFRRQIESGGPVTVTHPGMSRYFMLIEEAVQLVLQAAVLADGLTANHVHDPHTFVLDMGEPVPIIEVARRMIEFCADGKKPSPQIVYSGVRPGERLEERLTWPFEKVIPTEQPLVGRIYRSEEASATVLGDETGFLLALESLIEAARRSTPREELIRQMAEHIPGYTPLQEPIRH